MFFFQINFGSLMLNLTGVVLSSLLIGFYTWGSWSAISANPHVVIDVSVYATAILMAISIFLVSLMAMFMDCCSFALFGGYGADNYGVSMDWTITELYYSELYLSYYSELLFWTILFWNRSELSELLFRTISELGVCLNYYPELLLWTLLFWTISELLFWTISQLHILNYI